MDYEQLGNFSNFTFDEDITPERSAIFLTREIIFTIFCLIGICADSIIIFTIFRFKRMRTVPNLYLANWAIADLCSLIFTPSSFRILSVHERIAISPEFMCLLIHLGAVLHLTELLFVTLLSVDWFVAAHFPQASAKFRTHHKYPTWSIWVLSLISSCVTTGLCIEDEFTYFTSVQLLAGFCLLVLIIIVLQGSKVVRKYCYKNPVVYPNLMLTLTSALVICWMLGFLTIFIDFFLPDLEPLSTVAACLFFSSSFVNLTLLYCLDNDFQACLVRTFKCSAGDYADSTGDFENPIYRDTVVKSNPAVEIYFKGEGRLTTSI